MPDRPSDSVIDFYASAFCREVLDAAHPTRFSKERITYGSDIFTGFRGDIRPANTNDDIAEDTRLVGTRRLPLARLDDGPAVQASRNGRKSQHVGQGAERETTAMKWIIKLVAWALRRKAAALAGGGFP